MQFDENSNEFINVRKKLEVIVYLWKLMYYIEFIYNKQQ